LVVIAIIGILSSVVLTSLNGARTKAKAAAFKAEMDSLLPSLILKCDTADLVDADVPVGSTHVAGIATETDLDCDGDGTFSAGIAANNGITCTATLKESGITYVGAGC
jgi:hypothetical protein